MTPQTIKGLLQITRNKLGFHRPPPGSLVCEAAWYDAAFAGTPGYTLPYYKSTYYFLWTLIVDRIRRAGAGGVLEIGCGPGQLAAFLLEQGIGPYAGLDFSPVAIEMAKQAAPEGRFLVGDARTSSIYTEVPHDVLICTEVLEHIEDDLLVVSRFPVGVRCLFSVPSFPYESHVRHFKDAAAVTERYSGFFVDLDVLTLKSPKDEGNLYYLAEGTRSE